MTGIFAMMGSGGGAAVGALVVSLYSTIVTKLGTTLNITTTSVSIREIEGDPAFPVDDFPVTYAWTVTGDDIDALDPTRSATAFRATGMARGEKRRAIAYCDVAQAASGLSGRSAEVEITITRLS